MTSIQPGKYGPVHKTNNSSRLLWMFCFVIFCYLYMRLLPHRKCHRVMLLKLLNTAILKKLISKPTCGFCFSTKMEGVITTTNGATISAVSPTNSPNPKTNIISMSPINVKTPTDRPFRVSIEGNIGAGKSTLIKYFTGMPGLETYSEPIEWWRNVDGHNLFELMYTDIAKWLNVFQNYVQLTRLKIQTSKPTSSGTTVQMFERSVQNNRFCFLEQAYQSGLLHGVDYTVLNEWYKWIRANNDISLDLIVYLKSSPDVVYQRVKNRARPEESPINLEYLQQLHEAHEKWLMSDDERLNTTPVLVLDADAALDDIYQQYKNNERRILGYEKKGIQMVAKEDKEKVRRNLEL